MISFWKSFEQKRSWKMVYISLIPPQSSADSRENSLMSFFLYLTNHIPEHLKTYFLWISTNTIWKFNLSENLTATIDSIFLKNFLLNEPISKRKDLLRTMSQFSSMNIIPKGSPISWMWRPLSIKNYSKTPFLMVLLRAENNILVIIKFFVAYNSRF